MVQRRETGVSGPRQPPALALVAAAAVSVQCGAALATRLFDTVGPTGAVTLRLVLAAALMVGILRPRHLSFARADFGVVVAFGLTLAAMNLTFYEAISRIPLGVAVTVEFAGPLAVTIIGSRRLLDLVWAVLAGTGVALLTTGGVHHIDLVGVGMALLAGVCWAGYIVLSKETGRRFPGPSGLALAMIVAALVVLPVGLLTAGRSVLLPRAIGIGAAVALLSSVLPYSLELVALRRVTHRAFGVLLSLDPAVAALVGLVALGQHLTWRELAALLLVVAANAGSVLAGEGDAVAATGFVAD
jgi:inner membrane transporter RhtA